MDVATTLDNLGCVYQEMGNLPEALAKHNEALLIQRLKLGNDHTSVAASLTIICNVYQEIGILCKALAKHNEALLIDRWKLGNEHTDVAASKYNLVPLKQLQGQHEEAATLFQHCAEVYVKVYGAEHRKTTDALDQTQHSQPVCWCCLCC